MTAVYPPRSGPSAADLIALVAELHGTIAVADGRLVIGGLIDRQTRLAIDEYRQAIAIELMARRGDYDDTACAHELRTLKSLQGCILQDSETLSDHPQGKIACAQAEQALVDVPRLASAYRWLANPANDDHPEYTATLTWASHAALRLVAAGAALDRLARPIATQGQLT